MVRFKSRYLVIEVGAFEDTSGIFVIPHDYTEIPVALTKGDKKTLNSAQIAAAVAGHIRSGLLANFGSIQHAAMSHLIAVKYFNTKTGLGIVRVPRDALQMIWGTLTFMSMEPLSMPNSISSKRCVWCVRHVAGTIKSAQKAAIRLSTRSIAKKLSQSKSVVVRSQLQKDLSECRAVVQSLES